MQVHFRKHLFQLKPIVFDIRLSIQFCNKPSLAIEEKSISPITQHFTDRTLFHPSKFDANGISGQQSNCYLSETSVVFIVTREVL